MSRLLLVLSLAATGCGGVMMEGMPSDPIAFVSQQSSEGLLGIDEFRDAMSFEIRQEGDKSKQRAKRTTTVTLIVPSTRELRVVPDLGAGTLPLDWSQDGTHLLVGLRDPMAQTLSLMLWNRLTGAFSRVTPGGSAGLAAVGPGPIQLASVAFRTLEGGGVASGIRVQVAGRGSLDVPDSMDGETPDVSPDGVTVVFTRQPRRAGREAMMFQANLGQTQARPLGRGSQPRYSRDGRWIVFERQRGGQSDIWVMRSDGTAKRAVTQTSYDEKWPAISPRGRFVVYHSVRGAQLDQSQLYIARVEDGREIQLTQTGQNARPVW